MSSLELGIHKTEQLLLVVKLKDSRPARGPFLPFDANKLWDPELLELEMKFRRQDERLPLHLCAKGQSTTLSAAKDYLRQRAGEPSKARPVG